MIIKNTSNKASKKTRGFTLVELLVAMGLGLTMSAALVNMYIASKKNYFQDDETARLQENARYAMRVISRELSMSGFMGGVLDSSTVAPLALNRDCVTGANWALIPTNFIELIDDYSGGAVSTVAGTTFNANCVIAADLARNSDIFSVKRSADEKTLGNGSVLTAADDNQWYLRVSEYGAATSYKLLGAGASIPAADQVAGNLVDYWEYYVNLFYVRNYSTTAGDGIPSMCIATLIGNDMTPLCYVEGVQNIQLEFGVDSNGDEQADFFIANPSAVELDDAISVRIYLLMRAVNPITGYINDKSYRLGSTVINPDAGGNPQPFNDGFYRRVFSTTMKLRNPVRL